MKTITATELQRRTGLTTKKLSRWQLKGLINLIEPGTGSKAGLYLESDVEKVRFLLKAQKSLRDLTLSNLAECYEDGQMNLPYNITVKWK